MKLCQPLYRQLIRKSWMTFGSCGASLITLVPLSVNTWRFRHHLNSGSKFFNYKHSFSVVQLELVDAHYKFIVVYIGSYGRNSVGGIFAHSKHGKYLETHLSIPEDKQLPETLCLALMLLWVTRPFLWKLTYWNLTQDRRAKGTTRKTSSIRCFPDPGEWWKMQSEYKHYARNFKFIRRPYNHCRRIRTTLFLRLVFCIVIWEIRV
jgi:hypothetical protein